MRQPIVHSLSTWWCAVSCTQRGELYQSYSALGGRELPQTQPRENRVNMDWCQAESVEDPWWLSTSDDWWKPHHHIWCCSSVRCHLTSTLPCLAPSASSSWDIYATCNIRWRLDSIATLVHAFIASHVDYRLCRSTGWCTKEDNGQAATRPQCSCMCRI